MHMHIDWHTRFWCLSHLMDVHSDVSSRARGPNLGLSLHKLPHFVYASREGADEFVPM